MLCTHKAPGGACQVVRHPASPHSGTTWPGSGLVVVQGGKPAQSISNKPMYGEDHVPAKL
jgi:hypothetical protein